MPGPTLISVPELARSIGCAEQTIRRRLIEGRSDGMRLGRDWFFTERQAALITAQIEEARKGKKRQ